MNRKTLILSIAVAGLLGVMILPFILGNLFSFVSEVLTPKQTALPPTRLQFWNLNEDEELYTGIIQQFRAQQPNVIVTYKSYSSLSKLEEDYINALAEGVGPDIISVDLSWLIKHKNKFTPMPLSNTLANPEFYKANFLDSVMEQVTFMESVRDAQGRTKDMPRIYALPASIQPLGIMYNRAHLRRNFAKNTPGETWEEITRDAKGLTRIGSDGERIFYSGIASGDIASISTGLDQLMARMLQEGTTFYDATKSFVLLDQPLVRSATNPVIPAADAIESFFSYAKVKDPNYTWSPTLIDSQNIEKELQLFAKGELSMMFAYPTHFKKLDTLLSTLRESGSTTIDKNDVYVARFPQKQTAKERGEYSTYISFYPLAVSKASKNPGVAWGFISYLQNKAVQEHLFRKGGSISPQLPLLMSQAQDPVLGAFALDAGFAKAVVIPEPSRMAGEITTLLTTYRTGSIDATVFAKQLKERWQCYLQKIQGTLPENSPLCSGV